MNVVNIFDIYGDYIFCCDIFNDPCKKIDCFDIHNDTSEIISTCNDPSNIRILFDNFVFVHSKSLKERIGFEFKMK